MYTPFTRRIIAALSLACIGLSTIFALLERSKNMGFVWIAATAGASVLLVALITQLNPKRDTLLFIFSGIAGGVFLGASGFEFPQNVALWIWLVSGLGTATIAIVTDADLAQSKPVNRL